MEAAAVLAFAGLSYVVTQLSGKKKTEEFERLLNKGRKFMKVTQQELESHSTQVTQDLMLTLDDLGPRQGISFV